MGIVQHQPFLDTANSTPFIDLPQERQLRDDFEKHNCNEGAQPTRRNSRAFVQWLMSEILVETIA
jgi:hypothetical protein